MLQQMKDLVMKLQEQQEWEQAEYDKDMEIFKNTFENSRTKIRENKQLYHKICELKTQLFQQASQQVDRMRSEADLIQKLQKLPQARGVQGSFIHRLNINVPTLKRVPLIRNLKSQVDDKIKEVENKLKKELQEIEIKHNLYDLRFKQLLSNRESLSKGLQKKKPTN